MELPSSLWVMLFVLVIMGSVGIYTEYCMRKQEKSRHSKKKQKRKNKNPN